MVRAESALRWKLEARTLRFTAGERCLWKATLRARTLDAHFTELGMDGEAYRPPLELMDGVDALVTPSHRVNGRLPRLTRLEGAIRYVPAQFSHHYLEARGGMKEYLETIERGARHELARKVRRFASGAGGSACRTYRRPEEMSEFFRLALDLSARTYQDRLLDAGLPASDEFRREAMEAAARGEVRGYILSFQGRPAAYGYCQAQGRVLLYRKTGYDPELRNWSPGIVLLNGILEEFFAERRFRAIDFGSGDAQWKRAYSTASGSCATLYFLKPTFRNAFLALGHSGVELASDAVSAALDAIGVKQRLKRLLRSM